jgi:superfamily II DNA or RNA helicase
MSSRLARTAGGDTPWLVLAKTADFGLESYDLLRPPGRFWSDGSIAPALSRPAVDAVDVHIEPSPAELLKKPPSGDTWTAQTKRSLARLAAWFLLLEDPQRRLVAQPVTPLAHQASIVQHVLQDPNLRSVLIADEVGLGKTIEAALIIKGLLERQPTLRVLYLAPAGLVSNVREELRRLGLRFRSWVAGSARDATLDDSLVVASIHRAVVPSNFETFAKAQWDVIVVDECHHLSAYGPDGSASRRKWRLIEDMRRRLPTGARLVLLSGTPHQGHRERFDNLVSLLLRDDEPKTAVSGRVIYRTKEDVRDWEGRPLFPRREVRPATVLELSPAHRQWLEAIHELFEPGSKTRTEGQHRAAGWRAAQALQWATSSIEAGLGYLVRQAVRAKWDPKKPEMFAALTVLRPYRAGRDDEDVWELFGRIAQEVGHQDDVGDFEDIEEVEEGSWRPDKGALESVLRAGVTLLKEERHRKWDALYERILKQAGDEKVVLFAQPIETVTALARDLERRTGKRPAIVIGGQSELERREEIRRFWEPDGVQFLVSSRAGGEGINLQIARRLVHVDVPWNPMEMEQRVGRVHRFLSRRTILVDTLVVAHSREADMYDVARARLREIASNLATDEEKLQALFARVMALVAPEELQDVLSREAVGPLSHTDRGAVAKLVEAGFESWERFHRRFDDAQRRIRALPGGLVRWDDLEAFAAEHVGAQPRDGFELLQFEIDGAEVVSKSGRAKVLRVAGADFACGDYGGMPITGKQGGRVEQLGTNTPAIQEALRKVGLPLQPTGAAHVRWPEGVELPLGLRAPLGVLVIARLPYRLASAQELDADLRVYCVPASEGGVLEVSDDNDRAAIIRALIRAAVRREAEALPQLIDRLVTEELRIVESLRTARDGERTHQIRPAVLPLLAAIVS